MQPACQASKTNIISGVKLTGPIDKNTVNQEDKSKGATRVQELMYELKIAEVMTPHPIVVTPKTPMKELREILKTRRISGTPVMDGDKLVGIISIEDFIKWLADGAQEHTVDERMTKTVQTVFADEPLVHAINKISETGFGRLPVIDRESGSLVGLITNGDMIKGVLKKLEVDYHEEEIHRYRASHIFEDIVADDTVLQFKYSVTGGDLKKGGECSSGLKKTISRLGICPPIVRRAAIACYEAEINSIVYSEGGTMSVIVSPNKIQMVMKDSGNGIADIQKALEPGFSTAPDWVREMGFGAGMGFTNIQKNVDKMDIKSIVGKGTTLKMVINY